MGDNMRQHSLAVLVSNSRGYCAVVHVKIVTSLSLSLTLTICTHSEFVRLLYEAYKSNMFCIAKDKSPAEVRRSLHYQRDATPRKQPVIYLKTVEVICLTALLPKIKR